MSKKQHWRSLAELENAPDYQERLTREFYDPNVTEPSDGLDRRRFMQLMGASMALAGAAGCRWERREVLPYAKRPENSDPGQLKNYTTVMSTTGSVQPLMVETFAGRPIRIMGNAQHPYSKGALDGFATASILTLYDPDRSKVAPDPAAIEALVKAAKTSGGEGYCILSGAILSPSMARVKAKLAKSMPRARWVQYEASSRDNERDGTKLAFGAPYRVHLNFRKAEIIVALEDNYFGSGHPEEAALARGWSDNRNPESGHMNRMYVAESRFTRTGSAADHRLAVRSSQIKALALAIEAGLSGAVPAKGFLKDAKTAKFLKALLHDLKANSGRSVVTAGKSQPAEVHAIVHRINAKLKNVGKTIRYSSDPEPKREHLEKALGSLAADMNAGKVKMLVILDKNPVYDAPGDVDFAAALAKVPDSIHFGLYNDETARQCKKHFALAHYLASWGDAETPDGCLTIAQPLIAPLYKGWSVLEAALAAIGESKTSAQAFVRQTALERTRQGVALPVGPVQPTTTDDEELALAQKRQQMFVGWEGAWRRMLAMGYAEGTEVEYVRPRLKNFQVAEPGEGSYRSAKDLKNGEFELVFFDDDKVGDGRFANNAWLQETPDFLTKLTWDNAAIMNVSTAVALGVNDEDVITVKTAQGSVEAPVYVMPGQAPNTIAMAIGYGRSFAGQVGGDYEAKIIAPGFDVRPIRHQSGLYWVEGASVAKTGKTYPLASTQEHHMVDTLGREERANRAPTLVRAGSLAEYIKDPKFAQKMDHHPPLLSLFQEHDYSKEAHRWGMTIDLSRCTGCNACVVACNAENNVPVVGKDQVRRGRELHWLRIDRYFVGDEEDPRVACQPVACVHCENAPCEQVCPATATTHSEEGLNDMVYNRCIGTRYCANNCPYKVRRFNFHNYHENLKNPENRSLYLASNPNVTVRFRGVMEKCSYCVQRIHEAKTLARAEKRAMRDGDIKGTCEDACGTGAILFGDLNDKNSRVSKAQALPRAYAVLAELNIKPRTEYLARINNPSPMMEEVKGHDSTHQH